jgi:hypothetical protein
MPSHSANASIGAATGSSAGQLPDTQTQTLITLLSSLMPLLQRMQAQMGAPFGLDPWSSGQPGQHPGHPAMQNPLIDQQAAVSFVEDITADALRNLSTYLEAHAEHNGELDRAVAAVTHAARSFAARDYNGAFELIWQGYRAIAAARAVNPQLPPLRTSAQGDVGSSNSLAH